MQKRIYIRVVALIVCLVFIGLSASGLFAADKKSSRIDATLSIRKAIEFLISICPSFDSSFDTHMKQVRSPNDSSAARTMKPSLEITLGRPSTGD